MKTVEGYSKEQYTNASVLLAGGGAKAISEFATSGHNHDSSYLKYNGLWTSGNGSNVDNASGMIFAYGDHGVPGTWGTVATLEYSKNASYKLQIFGDGWDNELYYRNASSDRSGWLAWKHLLDDINYNTYINALDLQTLNVSGSATFSTPIVGNLSGNATTADRLKNDVSGATGTDWQPCKIEGGVIKYHNTDTWNANTVDKEGYVPASGTDAFKVYASNKNKDASWQDLWLADNNVIGGIKLYKSNSDQANLLSSFDGDSSNTFSQNSHRVYPIQLDSKGVAGVYVPWKNDTYTIPTQLPANGGNADTVDGYHAHIGDSTFGYFNRIPVIKPGDGVMEIGRYLDFHISNNETSDYTVRLFAESATVLKSSQPIYAPSFYQSSDSRLKNIINTISPIKAYDFLTNCNAYNYTLKADPDKEQIGVIALEVELYFPEVVSTDENGMKSVAYDKLSVILLQVCKDMNERLKRLER